MTPLGIRFVLVVAFVAAYERQPLAADWKTQKSLAETYAAQGRTDAALVAFDDALKEAQAPSERIETRLAKAALLERVGRDSSVDEIYQDALADASASAGDVGELRLLATNNYGAFLLRTRRPEKAAAVLRPIEAEIAASKAPPEAQARYFFNLAQAFERMDEPRKDDAFSRYVRVVKLDAAMTSASQSASSMALGAGSPSSGIAMSLELVNAQLVQKDFVGADALMREACNRGDWVRDPAYSSLLTGVVRYFTAAAMSPDTFARAWKGILEGVQRWSAGADLVRTQAVLTVYSGTVPLLLDRYETPLPFSGWRSSAADAETFSAFTKMVGDWYGRQATEQKEGAGSLRAALQRYGLAWNISSNVDAALYLANLLLERSADVDPSGEVLAQFIDRTFSAKGEAYVGNDWADVVRLHTVLGTIFERQKRWGPEYNPRSAVFQWRHAIQAQQHLGAKEPPALHERLATAYEGLARPNLAWSERVAAAQGYLTGQRTEEACQQLQRAAAIKYQPTAKESERLLKLGQSCSVAGLASKP
jgi:Tfp pilus assembly protein PilF